MNSLSVKSYLLSKELLPELSSQWIALESRASKSFFTSWTWIGTWLSMIHYKAKVVCVYDNQEIVGLSLYTIHDEKRPFHTSNQLWVNRTGEQKHDQIWSEYNDILCPRGREWAIRSAILHYLVKEHEAVDEFILGVSRSEICETPTPESLFPRKIWETVSYATRLQPEFKELDGYLASLSKNTRHQIRRSLKLLSAKGEVRLARATSISEALSMFEKAGVMHKQRWPGTKSGFNNPLFVDFHRELIKRSFSSGRVDLLCFCVADEPFCYLYNFIYDDYVYFYLSGIHYEKDNRVKPGLLAHAMAINLYSSENKSTYDFMGGLGQYKESLSNHKEKLVITSFQKKHPLFLMKHWLDISKNYWKSSGSLLHDRE